MSNIFAPRTTAPTVQNEYFRHTGYRIGGIDGLNECVIIDSDTGEVMPNCVGYTWGRAFEAMGERPRLSKMDAQNWYGTSDGYPRDMRQPQLGAVACWERPGIGDGHVAFIEIDNGDGTWQCSSSDYGGVYCAWKRLAIPVDSGISHTIPVSGFRDLSICLMHQSAGCLFGF